MCKQDLVSFSRGLPHHIILQLLSVSTNMRTEYSPQCFLHDQTTKKKKNSDAVLNSCLNSCLRNVILHYPYDLKKKRGGGDTTNKKSLLLALAVCSSRSFLSAVIPFKQREDVCEGCLGLPLTVTPTKVGSQKPRNLAQRYPLTRLNLR